MQAKEVMQAAAGMPATAEKQQQQGLHNRKEYWEKNRHQQTLATSGDANNCRDANNSRDSSNSTNDRNSDVNWK